MIIRTSGPLVVVLLLSSKIYRRYKGIQIRRRPLQGSPRRNMTFKISKINYEKKKVLNSSAIGSSVKV
jgi:hypothetical protein